MRLNQLCTKVMHEIHICWGLEIPGSFYLNEGCGQNGADLGKGGSPFVRSLCKQKAHAANECCSGNKTIRQIYKMFLHVECLSLLHKPITGIS